MKRLRVRFGGEGLYEGSLPGTEAHLQAVLRYLVKNEKLPPSIRFRVSAVTGIETPPAGDPKTILEDRGPGWPRATVSYVISRKGSYGNPGEPGFEEFPASQCSEAVALYRATIRGRWGRKSRFAKMFERVAFRKPGEELAAFSTRAFEALLPALGAGE